MFDRQRYYCCVWRIQRAKPAARKQALEEACQCDVSIKLEALA